MNHLVILGTLLVSFSAAMPINDCRDQYPLCGAWARQKYCEMNDYKYYMNLMCPESCGFCDDVLSGLSGSDQEPTDGGSSAGGQDDVHRVIPEIDKDFEHMEDLGSSRSQADSEADEKDESRFQSLSGSGEETNGQLFPASEETEPRFDDEAAPEDESGDQQEPISGSGFDSGGVNLWPVVRVEPGEDDGDRDRELRVSRRSEIATPNEPTVASDAGSSSGHEGSAFAVQISQASSGEGVLSQRSEVPASSSGSGSDAASGEDDGPFDNTAFDSESDSGCSSGYGCYESDGGQGEEDGNLKQRSSILAHDENAVISGSGSTESVNFIPDSHANATSGPYSDQASTSASGPVLPGSGSEKQSEASAGSHDIEDAIFETGEPMQVNHDDASGSGSPNPPPSEVHDKHEESVSGISSPPPSEIHDKPEESVSGISGPPPSEVHDKPEESGSGSGQAVKEESVNFAATPAHREKINLMERMMKAGAGDLKAIKISHVNVDASSRDEVPRLDDDEVVLSDLGKGRKVSFVLNQDFYEGYADEESVAYNVLANNVKKEVEHALGSKTVVSGISFSEVREPGESPRFSKVMTSLNLLGDVSKLEHKVRKGSVRNLVVDKTFFRTS